MSTGGPGVFAWTCKEGGRVQAEDGRVGGGVSSVPGCARGKGGMYLTV